MRDNNREFGELAEFLKGLAFGKRLVLSDVLVGIVAERTEIFRPMPEGYSLRENDWLALSAKQRMDWRDRMAYPTLEPTVRLIRARLSAEFEVNAVEDDPTLATATYEDLANWVCSIGIPKALAETEENVDWSNNYLRWNLIGLELAHNRKSILSDTFIFHVNAIYLAEREFAE